MLPCSCIVFLDQPLFMVGGCHVLTLIAGCFSLHAKVPLGTILNLKVLSYVDEV